MDVVTALGGKFDFTIANTSGAKKVIALFAGVFNTLKIATTIDTGVATNVVSYNDASEIVAAGYVCDAVLDDGTIAVGVVCSSNNSKMTIREFKNYIKHFGHVIVDISITANNADCFNETLEVIQRTPLDGSKSSYINLKVYRDPRAFDLLTINLKNVNLIAAFDTLALLPVATGREVSISFMFGS